MFSKDTQSWKFAPGDVTKVSDAATKSETTKTIHSASALPQKWNDSSTSQGGPPRIPCLVSALPALSSVT